MSSPPPGPFLKWAGGKRKLLPELERRLPDHFSSYHEPFLGGGALFFRIAADPARRPARIVLGDASLPLVSAWRAVRDDCEALGRALEPLEQRYIAGGPAERDEHYYAARERFNELCSAASGDVEVGALLLFLNRHAFNGLTRFSRAGRFNVPHGRPERPRPLDRERLRAASAVLRGVELHCRDFGEALAECGTAAFGYLDPPYLGLSPSSSFTAYTGAGFGEREQLRLIEEAAAARERGADLLASNSAHPWLRRRWEERGWLVEEVSAARSINSRGSGRGAVAEFLMSPPQRTAHSGRVRGRRRRWTATPA